MAAVDLAGFVADLKAHTTEHGFHVHDERHFVETYSLRQVWEVDLHLEDACDGPLDLHIALEADPRVQLAFEDAVAQLPPDEVPDDTYLLPLTFSWELPPLRHGPDLLVLATELASLGGTELPMRVSAIDSFLEVTDPAERTLTLSATRQISLAKVLVGEESMCDDLDRARRVSTFLLENAPEWIGDSPGGSGE